MQSKGLDFLRPIWAMIYSTENLGYFDGDVLLRYETYCYGLNLSEKDVSVTYTRYINNYKKDVQPNDKSIDEAIEAKLTPGKKFQNYSRN